MIIEINNLKKRYKKEWVLNGINITIEQPQIIALVGPNGAGKTTLLNCVTNMLSFQEGTINIFDKKHTNASIFYDVSFLQDNRLLYGNLTGYDHLKLICKVQNIAMSEINRVSEKIGMKAYLKQRVKSYSLGMKQHLLLSMAIINQPKLLLLDEPLNGLDPTSAINVRKILLELYNQGTTIIVSSHNLDEIDRLTNTVYFMKDGTLLKESIENMASEKYEITVNDVEKATTILTERKIPYQIADNNLFYVDAKTVPLQHLIDYLNEKDIEIANIEKQKIGAEVRYKELFEGELNV